MFPSNRGSVTRHCSKEFKVNLISVNHLYSLLYRLFSDEKALGPDLIRLDLAPGPPVGNPWCVKSVTQTELSQWTVKMFKDALCNFFRCDTVLIFACIFPQRLCLCGSSTFAFLLTVFDQILHKNLAWIEQDLKNSLLWNKATVTESEGATLSIHNHCVTKRWNIRKYKYGYISLKNLHSTPLTQIKTVCLAQSEGEICST